MIHTATHTFIFGYPWLDGNAPARLPCLVFVFEYLANILYALFVRSFSIENLWVLVVVCCAALIHFTVASKNGDVIGGWASKPVQRRIDFTRIMYPFFAGLLLCRMGKIIHIKQAFFWSSLLIILVLFLQKMGVPANVWLNGLYKYFIIIFIFLLIVLIGAGGTIKGQIIIRLYKFFGDISYPMYITYYPLIYIYNAWAANNKVPLQKAYPFSILLLIAAILIANASLKLYDEPVRKWLKNSVLKNN